MLEPLPEKDQSRPIPSKNLHSVRSLRPEYKNCPRKGILPSVSRTSATRPSPPFLKSTGFVVTRTFTPAGTAIMSPPSRPAAHPAASQDRHLVPHEPPRRQSRW